MRRPSRLTIVAVAAGVLLMAGVAVAVPAARAALDLRAAQSQVARAQADLGRGDRTSAAEALDRARDRAGTAADRLGSPAVRLFGSIPVAGNTLRAARDVATAAGLAADAAAAVMGMLPDPPPYRDGAVDVQALEAMREPLAATLPAIDQALDTASRAPARFVLAPVADARNRLVAELSSTRRGVEAGSTALQILPAALGAGEPRRYVILAQNAGENRATGGFWGNYGLLDASGGRMRLADWGRPARDLHRGAAFDLPALHQARYGRYLDQTFWQNINMSPDFPTVAAFVVEQMRAVPDAGAVDGVIAIDAHGLAALLHLTGPVEVQGWPHPLTAANAVDVVSLDAYREFADERAHHEFFDTVAHAVWSALASRAPRLTPASLGAVGEAFSERRIVVHLARDDEQQVVSELGVAGELIAPGTTDPMVAVLTQNAAANKADVYLHRELDMTVHVAGDGSADLEAVLTLRNEAPTSGEPSYIIGPNRPQFAAGENLQVVSIYLPAGAGVVSSQMGDGAIGVESDMGLTLLTGFVRIGAGESVQATVHARLAAGSFAPGSEDAGLLVRRQPALQPDALRVRMVPPRGWRIQGAGGGMLREQAVERDQLLEVRLQRTLLGRILPW